jgi:hypothetical protein
MIRSALLLERTYGVAIWLYPVRFRESHGAAMKQSLRDALADSELSKKTFLLTLIEDLIRSLLKENLTMFQATVSRPVLLYVAIVFTVLCTALSLGFVIIEQGMLRQTANDPQIGMATDLAARLDRGADIGSAIPNDQVDMDASLTPFEITFDEKGQVLASSAQLNGTVPLLPSGVLDHVRAHGEERLTWAPRRDVRIASVVKHLHQGGFVLAGRNLREIESRKTQILQMATLVWLGLVAIIVSGTFVFGWLSWPPRPALA